MLRRILALVLAVLLIVPVGTVYATDPVALTLSADVTTVAPGAIVPVTIHAANVGNMRAVDLAISYDASVLQVVNSSNVPTTKISPNYDYMDLVPTKDVTVNGSVGTVAFSGAASVNLVPAGTPLTDGDLATIRFKVISNSATTTQLAFTSRVVKDGQTNPLDSTAQGLSITVVPLVTVTQVPGFVKASSLTVGGTINDAAVADVFVVANPAVGWAPGDADKADKTGTSFSKSVSLTEGSNSIVVVAKSANAELGRWTYSTVSDTVKPAISLSGVDDGGLYGETAFPPGSRLAPVVTISDDHLDTATQQVQILTPGAAGPVDLEAGAEFSAEGEYTITASASDQAGNSDSKTFTFTIDLTGPTVTQLAVDKLYSDGDAVTISGVVAGATNVRVHRQNPDGTWLPLAQTPQADLIDGRYVGTIDLGNADGVYTVNLVATDDAGNQGFDGEQILKDTGAPSITDLSLSDNQNVTEKAFTVSATVTDTINTTSADPSGNETVQVILDGDENHPLPTTANGNSYSAEINLGENPANNSSHTITFKAADKAGNPAEATVTVKYTEDKVPLDWVVTNANLHSGKYYTRYDEGVSVAGHLGNDSVLPASLKLTASLNGGAAQDVNFNPYTGSFDYSVTLNLTKENSVVLTATTATGSGITLLPNQQTVTIVPDQQDPSASVTAYVTRGTERVTLDADHLARGGETITFEVTASDNIGLDGDPVLKVNGTPVNVTLASGKYTATQLVPASGNGSYLIDVTATDKAGRTAPAGLTAAYDADLPVVTVTQPDRSKGNSADFTFTVKDANLSSVSDGTNTLEPVSLDTDGTRHYSGTLPLTTEGTNSMTLTATDLAGNQQTATVTGIKDAAGPALTAVSPEQNGLAGKANPAVVFTLSDQYGSVATTEGAITVTLIDNSGANPPAWTVDTTLAFETVDAHTVQVTATPVANVTLDNDKKANVRVRVTAADDLNNQVTLDTWTFSIDTNFATPTPSLAGSVTTWYKTAQTITLNTDLAAPSVKWALKNVGEAPPIGANELTTTGTSVTVPEGRKMLYVSTESATVPGNFSPVFTFGPYLVDSQAPGLSGAAVTKSANRDLKVDDHVTVSVKALDTYSGVAPDQVTAAVHYTDFNGANKSWDNILLTYDPLLDTYHGQHDVKAGDDGQTFVVTITAQDRAGNSATATPSASGLVVDTTAPVISFTAPDSPTKTTSLILNFTVTERNLDTVTSSAGTVSVVNTTGRKLTASLTEGTNTFTLTATDKAGNVGTATVTVDRDTTGPVLGSVSPANQSTIGDATPEFRIPATDTPAGLGTATMYVTKGTSSTKTYITLSKQDGVYSGTPTADLVGPGTTTLIHATAEVQDALGNKTPVTWSFTINTNVPQVTAAIDPQPNSAGWVKTKPTITLSPADATVKYLVVSTGAAAPTVDQLGTYTAPFLLDEGAWDVYAMATSTANGLSSEIKKVGTYKVDLTDPVLPSEIAILNPPADRPYKAGDTLQMQFSGGEPGLTAGYVIHYQKQTAADSQPADATLTGNFTATAGDATVYAASIPIPQDGANWTEPYLTLTLTDPAGRSVTSSSDYYLGFTVDNVPPAINGSTSYISPTNPLKAGGLLTITLVGDPWMPTAKALFYDVVNGQASANPTSTVTLLPNFMIPSQYEGTYTVGSSENRTVKVVLQLTDAAGNSATFEPGTVTFDTLPPVITSVQIVNPAKKDGGGVAYYKAGDTINFKVVTESGLPSVKVTIAGLLKTVDLTESSTHGEYTGSYQVQSTDTTQAPGTSGQVVLVGSATDLAGNQTQGVESTGKLVIDNTLPQVFGVTLVAPPVLSELAGHNSLGIIALAEPKLQSVTATVTTATGAHIVTLAPSATNPGIYKGTYTVVAGDEQSNADASVSFKFADWAGNELTPANLQRTVAIDTTNPVVGALAVKRGDQTLTATDTVKAGDVITLVLPSDETKLAVAGTIKGIASGVPMTYAAGQYTASITIKKGMDTAGAETSATAMDPGGHSVTQTGPTIKVDTLPPFATATLSKAKKGLSDYFIEKPTVTFTVEKGATLVVKNGDNVVTLDASAAGTSTTDVYTWAVADGEYTALTYTATDAAGNVTSGSLPPIKVDTSAPTKPALDAVAPVTQSANITVSGHVTETDVVRVDFFVNDAFKGSADVTDKAFSRSVALQEDMTNKGVNNIKVKAVDKAGNTSPASDPVTVTRDTTPPDLGIELDQAKKTVDITVSEPLTAAGVQVDPDHTTVTLTAATPATSTKPSAKGTTLTIYHYTFTLNAGATSAELTVTGQDAAGNTGKGHIVQAVIKAEAGGQVQTDDGDVTADFGAGALAGSGDQSVTITSYVADNLNAFAPRGTRLLGSAYDFKATLKQKVDGTFDGVDVTFKVDMTGFVPAQLGVYYFPLTTNGMPELIPATVTDQVTNNGVTTATLSAHLPHFSVFAPFGDAEGPALDAAILVNTADAGLTPTVKTATVTISGSVDGTALQVRALAGGNPVGDPQVWGAMVAGNRTYEIKNVPVAGDGLKTFDIEATDNLGNTTTRTITFNLDTTAPALAQGDVTVNGTQYVGDKIFTNAATVGISAAKADALLTLKQGATAVVTDAQDTFNVSPALTANVDTAFQVTARDTALDAAGDPTGNVSNPVTVTVRRDTAAPVIQFTGLNNSGTTVTQSQTLTIRYNAVQQVGLATLPEDVETATISLDNGGEVTPQDLNADLTLDLHSAEDKTYTLTATVTDKAGNSTTVTRSIRHETAAPTVDVTAGAVGLDQGTVDLTIKTETDADLDIAVNGTSVKTDKADGNGDYSFTATLRAEGANQIDVTATSATTGKTGTGSVTVTRDLLPTATGISPAADTTTTASTASISFTLSEPATVVVERQEAGGAWQEVYTGNGLVIGSQTISNLALPNLAKYNFRLKLTDATPNTNTVNVPGAITRQQSSGGGGGGPEPTPAPTITASAATELTKDATVEITGSATSGAEVTITKGGQTLKTLTSTGSFSYTAALTEGANEFTLTAKNAGGTASASVTVTRDTTPPALSVSGPDGTVSEPKAILTINTERGAHVTVNGQAAGTARESGLITTEVHLNLGDNLFQVTAADALGNTASASATITRVEPKQVKVSILADKQKTAQTSVSVRGTATTGSTVTIGVNGDAVGTAQLDADGHYTFTVQLPEIGQNTITASAKLDQAVATDSVTVERLPLPELKDTNGHWAEGPIKRLVAEGIVSGFEDGSFKPEESVTRAQFAKLIALALGLQIDDSAPLNLTDADQIPAWARGYVAAAVKAGLITGFEDGSFRADQEITRIQIAVILSRGLKVKGVNPSGDRRTFTDSIPAWAQSALDDATRAGLITGNPDGSFKPNDKATRAQAAVMTVRLMDSK